ncbi:MAG: hypothetical protein ACKVVP_24310 [Chloroflexota bacterium]
MAMEVNNAMMRRTHQRLLSIGFASVAIAAIAGCAPAAPTTGSKDGESKPSSAPAALVSVIQVPTPAPPAGSPAAKPAPAPLPASYSEPIGDFALYMEVLAGAGPTEFGLMANPGCVMNSMFKRGMKLVWRFELYDLATRKRLTNQDGATVTLAMPNQELPARFSQRGQGLVPDGPWTWVAAWTVPMTQPLGSLDYSIKVAGRDGRTGVLTAPALISENADTRIKIIE